MTSTSTNTPGCASAERTASTTICSRWNVATTTDTSGSAIAVSAPGAVSCLRATVRHRWSSNLELFGWRASPTMAPLRAVGISSLQHQATSHLVPCFRYFFGIPLAPTLREAAVPKNYLALAADGDYAPVAERLALFWARFPTGRVVTELRSRTEREVTFQASLFRSADEREPA